VLDLVVVECELSGVVGNLSGFEPSAVAWRCEPSGKCIGNFEFCNWIVVFGEEAECKAFEDGETY